MSGAAAAVAFLIALGAALAGAAWNLYPLVFYDTGDYIAQSFTFVPLVYRTFPYSLFLAATHVGWSLWLPILAQAAITAWVMREFVAAFVLPERQAPTLMLAALALALGSAMPWVAGQLMPDAFVAPLALAFAILLFERGRLPAWRRGILAGIAALGCMTHLTQLALGVGLLGFGLLARTILRGAPGRGPRLGAAALGVAVALVAIPGVNQVLTGRALPGEAGPVFIFARMLQDGLIQSHLDRTCPTVPNVLCGYRSQLPDTANDFLWKRDSVLVTLGGWYGFRPIASETIAAAIRGDPVGQLLAATRNAARQVVRTAAGEGLFNQWETTREMVARHVPAEAAAYDASRQQRELLDFEPLNAFQVPLALIALAMLPLLAVRFWRQGRTGFALAQVTLVMAILGNAAICGVLSNPTDRYQARITWVALLAVVVAPGVGGRGGGSFRRLD